MLRKAYIILAATALVATNATRAEFPARIEQPMLDEFGVELKSGRYGALTIPVITIGGGDPYQLSELFAPQSGVDIILQSVFDIKFSQIRDQNIFYDMQNVQYPGGSIAFRRRTGSTGAWIAEYQTGATYTDAQFTDQYGVRIVGDKLIYPDGREVCCGTRSSGVDPVSGNAERYNNFGYRIRRSSSGFQAINMAVDACPAYSTASCASLNGRRVAQFQRKSALEAVLTDASGGVTRVTFSGISAFDAEPTCNITSSGQPRSCSGTSWTYYYPVKVVRPGKTDPALEISYTASGDGADTVTHEEILVSTIRRDGILASYATSSNPNGSWGGQNGRKLNFRTTAAGSTRYTAGSSSGGPQWPLQNLNMDYFSDALSRTTYYQSNATGAVSKSIRPEGDAVELKFDARYNIIEMVRSTKTGTSLASVSRKFAYPECNSSNRNFCNKPSSVTDYNGNITEYKYNDKGQETLIRLPASVSGGVSSTTRNLYTLRTAYILDTNGNVVPAGGSISLLTQSTQCRTSESCSGTGDEIVTDYDYGPTSGLNNLQLRGKVVTVTDGGVTSSLRTCYTYNYYGEKVSETKPSANLSTCK